MNPCAYLDEDELRDAHRFFRDLARRDEELPDTSFPAEQWRPDNKPHGRLSRRTNASTYVGGSD